MQSLLEVILPVFLVLGFGYLAVWRGWFQDAWIDGLMRFAQNFAIPCLLFRSISRLDLSQGLDPALLITFYTAAITCFLAGLIGARVVFDRPWPDAVAIGFVCLFSNSLLLGVPITERAWGPEALAGNIAIIAIHSPLCYGIGITAMEIALNAGRSLRQAVPRILRAMFRNAMVLAILAGFAVNLSGLTVPPMIGDAADMMARAALPAALFGLGGTLWRYRPEGDMRTIAMIVLVSLVLHPAMTWGLGRALALETPAFRSAVITAAMAPGINAYLFANMYGVARRVVASAVLVATGATMLTALFWLTVLP